MSKAILPADYADFLSGVKQRIRNAQITASRAVNRELIGLYWDIGSAIVEKHQTARWGVPSWNGSPPTCTPSSPTCAGFRQICRGHFPVSGCRFLFEPKKPLLTGHFKTAAA